MINTIIVINLITFFSPDNTWNIKVASNPTNFGKNKSIVINLLFSIANACLFSGEANIFIISLALISTILSFDNC